MGLFNRRAKTEQNGGGDNSAGANGNSTGNGQKNGSTAPNGVGKSNTYPRNASSASPAVNASMPTVPLPRAPDPNVNPAAYLRSIYAVRERSRHILDLAKKNQLKHFFVDMTKFDETAQYVVSIIKVLLPDPQNALLWSLTSS